MYEKLDKFVAAAAESWDPDHLNDDENCAHLQLFVAEVKSNPVAIVRALTKFHQDNWEQCGCCDGMEPLFDEIGADLGVNIYTPEVNNYEMDAEAYFKLWPEINYWIRFIIYTGVIDLCLTNCAMCSQDGTAEYLVAVANASKKS